MEAMGAFFDEEWDSLGKMFFSEDTDLMFQLHGDGLFSNDSDTSPVFAAPSIFWPVNGGTYENVAGVDGTLMCSDTLDYANFHNISQESSNSSASDGVFPNPGHEFYQANHFNHLQVTNNTTESMNFWLMEHKNSSFIPPVFPDGTVMEDIICPREEIGCEKMGNAESQQPANVGDSGNEMLLKRKFNSSEVQFDDGTNGESSENPKKKSRVPRNAPKTKKYVQPKSKKNQKDKQVNNEEDETNIVQNGQSSSCYSSEDESNASQESNGGATSDHKNTPALNLNGKTRATRGSATDPQSLYARRRRERINERLRILQNLIPNGTKVDISTMLEEAVHYVKFLQLQIKLLSSDDTWMYAPIVYNGLDIGLYGRIFPTI